MSLIILNAALKFPDPSLADDEGLIAVGGDLSPARLLLAYRMGIFPWYAENEPILWWSPDPRFILYPSELKVSKSMRTVINSGAFKFTVNRSFPEVIRKCKDAIRYGEKGSWINDDIVEAYTQLHKDGYAHSAETWHEGKLTGGLYGIRIGNFFFGESMFSDRSNASKFAFIRYVDMLGKEGVTLIDCQMHTPHLASLGARMISRKEFLDKLSPIL